MKKQSVAIFGCMLGAALSISSCGRSPSLGANTLKDEPAGCTAGEPAYADTVVRAEGASGAGFGDPKRAANGVRGGGAFAGGMDVFSLDQATDGVLTLRWVNRQVCNQAGVDFAVFENGFTDRRTGVAFFEPIVVSVSIDGIDFVEFPHEFFGSDHPELVGRRDSWRGFAGLNAVLYHEENNGRASQGINPLDPIVAGGDGFDLDQLPETEAGRRLKTEGFRFIRLTGAPILGFPRVPMSGQGLAEIDGVYAGSLREVAN